MPAFFTLVFVVVLVLIFQFPVRGEKQVLPPVSEPVPAKQEQPQPPKPVEKRDLTRDELMLKLEKLDKETEKYLKMEPPPMAMCYAPMKMDDKPRDFICPTCMSKTSYEGYMFDNVEQSRQILKDLPLKTAVLDETDYCKKCRPDVTQPKLYLVYQVPGEKDKRRVETGPGMLTEISVFLGGPGVTEVQVGEAAKQYQKRIHDFFGIPVEDKK